jgi:hypothetical protein
MKTKHTPGPWISIDNTISDDGDTTVALVCSSSCNTDEYAANLQLIRSAPELLEALDDAHALAVAWAAHYQGMHGLKELHPKHAEILKRIQSALLKAGGV